MAKLVRSRQWPLVHLHLNRVAWRYLTLKMAPVYYPLETPPSYRSSCSSSFVAYSISRVALRAALKLSLCGGGPPAGASECIVYAAIRETYCRPANNERFPRGRSEVFILPRQLETLRSVLQPRVPSTHSPHSRANRISCLAIRELRGAPLTTHLMEKLVRTVCRVV